MASEASKYIPFLDPNREGGKFMSEDIGTDTLLATDIAADAVDTEELKNGAVTTPKIADAPNGVSTVKINDVAVTTAKIADATVNQSKLSYEVVAITVAAAATSGTGTCTSDSIILGYYPTGNQDQLVDNVAVSGTTVTITLAAAATTANTFNVVLLKA